MPPSQKDILGFWLALEHFQPFELDEVTERHSTAFTLPFPCSDEQLPWNYLKPADGKVCIGYDFYCCVFDALYLETSVEKTLGISSTSFNDQKSLEGQSCFLRFFCTGEGIVRSDRTRFSTMPWAVSRIMKGELDTLCKEGAFERHAILILEKLDLIARAADDAGNQIPLTAELLCTFIKNTSTITGWDLSVISSSALVVPYYAKNKSAMDKDKNSEEEEELEINPEERARKRRIEILNSFYISDLSTLLHSKSESTTLSKYLAQVGDQNRTNLLDPKNDRLSQDLTSVNKSPYGGWPRAYPLSLMQQLALNCALSGKNEITAVNGPPGTGKTTLLADLTASIYINRAKVLSGLRTPTQAFSGETTMLTRRRSVVRVPKLIPQLTGFEMVVASSNNTAVENLSRELPSRSKLKSLSQDLTYLAPVTRFLETLSSHEEDSWWGVYSAALGKRANRQLFCKALLWGIRDEKPEEKKDRLSEGKRLTLLEFLSRGAPKRSFAEARQEFNRAWKAMEKARDIAGLPDSTQFQISWQSSDFLTTQANLFRAAISLHEAWIYEVFQQPKYRHGLRAIGEVLSSRNLEGGIQEAWQLLFMIVPVVSTTFASVANMFDNLPPSTLGWLLIDEAGQALPHAAAGAIWRSKRAVVVGDPQQLEPILRIPDILISHVGEKLVGGSQWLDYAPNVHSCQTFVDRNSRLGAELVLDDLTPPVWVGTPLRVHNRCLDPMFTISNRIAYGGAMLQARATGESPTKSRWVNISGNATSRQWVAEHGQRAMFILEQEMLNQLQRHDGIPSVFLISPFREVSRRLKAMTGEFLRRTRLLNPHQIEYFVRTHIGTVHTFQGKEANTVILVLGADHRTKAAAIWAGDRPNLLNVAVTRARDQLIVIGDIDLWKHCGVFGELALVMGRLAT